jgi:hypothetical protein
MAKKSKRQTRKVSPTRVIEAPGNSPFTSQFASSAKPSEADFTPNYSYTIKDLKRIGILAGSFFVILIAMALILPIFVH